MNKKFLPVAVSLAVLVGGLIAWKTTSRTGNDSLVNSSDLATPKLEMIYDTEKQPDREYAKNIIERAASYVSSNWAYLNEPPGFSSNFQEINYRQDYFRNEGQKSYPDLDVVIVKPGRYLFITNGHRGKYLRSGDEMPIGTKQCSIDHKYYIKEAVDLAVGQGSGWVECLDGKDSTATKYKMITYAKTIQGGSVALVSFYEHL